MKPQRTLHPFIPMEKDEANALQIMYSLHTTHYGETLIASTTKGVCYLAFGNKTRMVEELKECYPKATIKEQPQPIHNTAMLFISGEKCEDDVALHVSGTPFQLSVWKALLDIPCGSKATYKSIAENIGKPKATRAVGTAIGQNPVSYLIPCHRVIRSDGGLGGYHWGIDIKQHMLNNENDMKREEKK